MGALDTKDNGGSSDSDSVVTQALTDEETECPSPVSSERIRRQDSQKMLDESLDIKQKRYLVRRTITGERRKRAELVRYSHIEKPITLKSCESLMHSECSTTRMPLISSCLNACDIWGLLDDEDEFPAIDVDPVVVAIEATAICGVDWKMESKASRENSKQPKLKSNFVGVVCHCSKEATQIFGIRQGTRVASFIPWLANAKYVTIPPKYLVAVSKNLDAADIVSVTSFFLPAFEFLHFGRERALRYSQRAIKGKRVFIKTCGVTLQVQALIRLSRFAGASEVYVSAPRDQLSSLVKQRVATLSDDPDCWLPVVRGGMDLVLDLDFPADLHHVKKSLARKGRLICCRNPNNIEVKNACSPFIQVEHLFERSQLAVMKRASLFSFVEYVNQFRAGVCKDLEFLFKLLQRRQIRPKIDRFITLVDLPDIDDEIQKNNLPSGAVICEPWKAKEDEGTFIN